MAWGQSLRSRLMLVATALTVVSVVAVSAVNIGIAQRSLRQTVEHDGRALALARATAVADWVQGAQRAVRAMLPAAAAENPQPWLQMIVKAAGFDTTYIGWSDKRYLFSSPQNLPPTYDPTARPWYQAALGTQDVALTEPYVDAGTGKLVMTFAAAVRENGQVQAVVAGDIFMDVVKASIDAIKPTPSSQAFIVSRDGRLIAHPNTKLILQPATSWVEALDADVLNSLVQSSQRLSWQNADWLLVGQPIRGTDWQLVIALHEGEAMTALRPLMLNSLLGALLVGLVSAGLMGWLLHRSLGALRRLDYALQEVASGDSDLTRRLPTDGVTEVARISDHFNTFVAKLQSVLLDIRQTSVQVHTAAEEISAGNLDLSTRTEGAASSLQQTAATMEQMNATVAQTAQQARQASRRTDEVAEAAQRGGQLMHEVTGCMTNISTTSQKVGDIVNVIDGIAFQTNILALNAAVEAARAGEAGRGFAVVAGEVRALAQRSAQAAREIKALIEASVAQVHQGSEMVHRAGDEIQQVVQSIQSLAAMMRDIAMAVEEQRSGIEQIGAAVSSLDQSTQQNAALVEQGAAAATALKQQAAELAAAVGRFRVDQGQEQPSALAVVMQQPVAGTLPAT
ncbi:MAG: methyl-accepting chemotaxis protein [Tepidimonas sp.]|uniref:methyl-accepting chemotaxis protein n=1 Tax=Tepidimonas sp. TaxID=2002775 RepID=UPI00298EE6B7|nr:methyl-accepting chemotaxis protein [Tepidimonas sp.]MDW8336023.1 methyl-accepting chemotaxis protein [Tepidimonas sp.]